ncbi:MAG: S-layer family protein, partial [Dokdonella sp.]
MKCAYPRHQENRRRRGSRTAARYHKRRKDMAAQVPRFVIKPSLLAILLAFPTQQALAANCTWNPDTGNWATAVNWSCGIVPGAGDNATIAVDKTVTVNGVQSILNLTNAGSVNLDAFLLTLSGGGGTTNTGTINVGAGTNHNHAALQISAGNNVNNSGGVINVSADSVINQFGSTITGGSINTTGSGRLVAFNSGANFLSGVTLNGSLDLASGAGIERIINGLTLNGTVNIGNNSAFAPQGNQTLGGTGTIVFADANASSRFNVEAGTLTLGSGITVRGGNGVIGQQSFVGGAATLINQGLISADVAGRTITLGVNGQVINQGTMQAQNGGTLHLNTGGGYDNSAGTLLADNGSTVLFNGATVTGGVLNSNGTGVFKASNSGANFLNGVTLNGTLDMATTASIERISAGLVLNGTINIGNGSVLAPQGNQTISGSGTIAFADGSSSNRLNVEAGNLVIGSGVTVRGQTGVIGQQSFVGGAATLTNNGTLQADVAGGTITLAVNGLTTNNGTLAALNGGTLRLDSNIAGGVGSQIFAGAGSTVLQNGVTVSGTINTAGSGSFRASNSGANFLDGVSLAGTLDLASATGIERLTNGLTLSGSTINIGNGSVLAPQGNQTISGTGTIVFTDGSGSNRLNVEAGNLVIGSGVTVRGQTGIIGQQSFVGGAATLTNNGAIQADVAGGAITIQVNGTTTNNGTLAALNGGTLNLNSAIVGTTGSQILAGAGSVVNQNGVTISGDMNLTGAGSFRASNNGNNFLSGVTLSGTLDLASATGIESVAGGLTLNGATINIGNNSLFAPQGNQTIGGTGTIVFADTNSSNRFNVEAGTLTLASGITIRGGAGTIGSQAFVGGAAALINQGLIAADVAGRTVVLTVNGTTTNQNLIKAANGGTLRIDSAVNNSAGTLLADAGGIVQLSGTSITGGTLASNGSGVFRATNSGANFINGTTLNGVLDLASSTSIVRISDGGMVLNGRIDLGSNSILAPQGNQTFSGTGSIVFADSGSNRLNLEAGTTTIGTGVTVRGVSGVIGQQSFVGGAAALINQGTINSDGGGTISINPNGAITNDGLLRAQNGTLAVQRNVSGSGTLQVDAAGLMTLANGGNTQGRLLMGNAGASLNLGSGNLVINTDYTNGAAGSGNTFNRRIGVSGTGQIVAGGDVAQVITGAGVSGGNTTNATLTIGSVRVGSTTFDYQIGNAGTTGPTLRGAIQTAANGGNITDARLGGSGVTASNYNAGAPGGNSGNLAVTFTAASAGALAPLAGQVVNLRSNFENIADQKLNIVLGAGAAAYNAAVGSAGSPVTVVNQHVGGSQTAALTVSNIAPGGAFTEGLNASFGVNGGAATNNGGSISLLAGGASNNSAMRVGVDTSTAGAKSGTVTLNYQTDGTGTSGLAAASAGSQTVNVSGNVYRFAQPNTIGPINFGNVLAGSTQQRTVTISNLAAADGFSEALNAAFGTIGGTNAGRFSTSGSITGLLAGNTDNTGMIVTLNTSAAGTVSANVQILLASNGTAIGNGLGITPLATQEINLDGVITGTIGNLASAGLAPTTVNFGKFREGQVSSQTQQLTVTNLTSGPGEGLNASFGANTGTASNNGGSITSLATDASNNTLMRVTLNGLATVGAKSGTTTVNFASDGSFNSGVPTTLPSQTVNMSAEVYRLAQAGVT